MQVIEKSVEGLSRSYGVRVPAAELGAALDARIAEITPTLNLKGFRPGKVPAGHVRRVYGKALMSEVLEKTLNETSQQVLNDNHLRVAAQPDLKPVSDMEQVLAGREDLAYDLEVEVIPEFDPIDVATLTLTRLVYQPTDEEVDEALGELVAQNRTYEPRTGKSLKAKDGDQLLVDFVGRIDGEDFDGGTANDVELVIGSGQFIPGFEEQLVGAAPDADLTVNVTFPEEYAVDRLKGKAAAFEVKVKEVRAPKAAEANDALAEQLGLADLAALKDVLRTNLESQYKGASRFKLKRALLDVLDTAHVIDLPPRMVEAEFATIWRQVEQDKEQGEASPEDDGKSEETLKAEYRQIAERRVRLGLVLAEIGRRENVVVTEAELGEAMRAEAMRYGEQARQVFDMLRQNPNVQNQMRAPLYEEKVVDLIIGRASVTDEPVSKEELLREDDEIPAAEPAKPAAKAKKVKKNEEATVEVAPEAPAAEEPAAKPKVAKAKKAEEASAEVEATPETLDADKPKAVKAKAKPKAAKPEGE